MIEHRTQIRAAYQDTDQMGLVHHSAYVRFCETARWEAFRAMGMPYSRIEAEGIIMPVITMHFEFKKPAYYDDIITIKTTVSHPPKSRICISYEMFRNDGTLINIAETTLVFMIKRTFAPCYVPDFIMQHLLPYFPELAHKE